MSIINEFLSRKCIVEKAEISQGALRGSEISRWVQVKHECDMKMWENMKRKSRVIFGICEAFQDFFIATLCAALARFIR